VQRESRSRRMSASGLVISFLDAAKAEAEGHESELFLIKRRSRRSTTISTSHPNLTGGTMRSPLNLGLAAIALVLCTGVSAATIPNTSFATIPNHTPLGEADDTMTSPSRRDRQVLPFAKPADQTLFKEIVPCRLLDTRGDPTTLPATLPTPF